MSGIIDLFIPKEKKFFEYLQKQAALLESSNKLLRDIVKKKKIDQKILKKSLKEIDANSEKGDKILNEVLTSLHESFITPIDREYILLLSTNINRSINSIKKIVIAVQYYQLKSVENTFLNQLELLDSVSKELKTLFEKPLAFTQNKKYLQTIQILETKADQIYRKNLDSIIFDKTNLMNAIRMKDIYDKTEDAIDDMKYIADIFQIILINA
jgi:uncharacterized protein Yka (UPF0111/DUF47 family)